MRAVAAVGEAVDGLARGLCAAVKLLDPHVIVLGGGVASEWLRDMVAARMRELEWALPVGDVAEIRLAAAGADAGVLGAGLAAARAQRT